MADYQFSGLCIGGCMDGMRLVTEKPIYKTPMLPKEPPWEIDLKTGTTSNTIPFVQEVYTRTVFHYVDGKGVEDVGMWLHPDYPTIKAALDHMADVYSNATKATRRK